MLLKMEAVVSLSGPQQTVGYKYATCRKCSNFKAETSAFQKAVAFTAEINSQKTIILTYSTAVLQFIISNTSDQQIHQLLQDLQLPPQECTLVLQWIQAHCGIQWNERAYHLGANNCNPCPPPLTRKPKPFSETAKDVKGEGPLETTNPLWTQSTVWQDMSRPLYSGCEQDTVACVCTWSELASRTLKLCNCNDPHVTIVKSDTKGWTTDFWWNSHDPKYLLGDAVLLQDNFRGVQWVQTWVSDLFHPHRSQTFYLKQTLTDTFA